MPWRLFIPVATSSQTSRPGKVSEYQVLTPSKKSPLKKVLAVSFGNSARRRFSRIDSVGRSGMISAISARPKSTVKNGVASLRRRVMRRFAAGDSLAACLLAAGAACAACFGERVFFSSMILTLLP